MEMEKDWRQYLVENVEFAIAEEEKLNVPMSLVT